MARSLTFFKNQQVLGKKPSSSEFPTFLTFSMVFTVSSLYGQLCRRAVLAFDAIVLARAAEINEFENLDGLWGASIKCLD